MIEANSLQVDFKFKVFSFSYTDCYAKQDSPVFPIIAEFMDFPMPLYVRRKRNRLETNMNPMPPSAPITVTLHTHPRVMLTWNYFLETSPNKSFFFFAKILNERIINSHSKKLVIPVPLPPDDREGNLQLDQPQQQVQLFTRLILAYVHCINVNGNHYLSDLACVTSVLKIPLWLLLKSLSYHLNHDTEG